MSLNLAYSNYIVYKSVEVILKLHPHRNGFPIFRSRNELDSTSCLYGNFCQSSRNRLQHEYMLDASVLGKDCFQNNQSMNMVAVRFACVVRSRMVKQTNFCCDLTTSVDSVLFGFRVRTSDFRVVPARIPSAHYWEQAPGISPMPVRTFDILLVDLLQAPHFRLRPRET